MISRPNQRFHEFRWRVSDGPVPVFITLFSNYRCVV
jgi:hypothetical protein